MAKCSDSINAVKNKLAFTHDLISTSYHEAGHTVYGLLHLMKVGSVQVFPDEYDRINGFTHFEFLTIDEIVDPELLKYATNSEVGFRYAGLTSEKYYFKTVSGSDKLPVFLKDGSSEDTLLAAKLIKQYKLAPPGKRRYFFKKRLIKDVLNKLCIHWDAVNLVAHGLFQKKRLYYSDLKELLTKNGENRKFWREQFKIIDNFYENYQTLDENDLRMILVRLDLL